MKFSIRDLLLVTVIVAIAVAWRADHGGQAAETRSLKAPPIPVHVLEFNPTEVTIGLP